MHMAQLLCHVVVTRVPISHTAKSSFCEKGVKQIYNTHMYSFELLGHFYPVNVLAHFAVVITKLLPYP